MTLASVASSSVAGWCDPWCQCLCAAVYSQPCITWVPAARPRLHVQPWSRHSCDACTGVHMNVHVCMVGSSRNPSGGMHLVGVQTKYAYHGCCMMQYQHTKERCNAPRGKDLLQCNMFACSVGDCLVNSLSVAVMHWTRKHAAGGLTLLWESDNVRSAVVPAPGGFVSQRQPMVRDSAAVAPCLSEHRGTCC